MTKKLRQAHNAALRLAYHRQDIRIHTNLKNGGTYGREEG